MVYCFYFIVLIYLFLIGLNIIRYIVVTSLKYLHNTIVNGRKNLVSLPDFIHKN